MTPERWQQLKPLYDAAVDLPQPERAHFVARHCAQDPELQAQLEELLHASDQPSDSRFDPLVNFRSLLPEPPTTLAEGVILLGRFKIIRLLGSGGMGDVYEANDLLLRPGRIALKTIRAAIAENPSTLARFKEEVVLARRINGNNVCRIHELYLPGQESGSPCAAFLTMEYLEGVTLASRIAAHTGSQSPIEIKEACLIADQLCAALQAVQDAGVIHRDLKPNNIMLVPRRGTEEVVLMDFGLARRTTVVSADGETGLSVPGTIMGAPEYMAPEQFEGREATAATDIYALGIVLYELATGRRPFAGDSAFATAVRRARRPDPPSSVRRGLPNTWDEVIARCLEYDPERRYQSPNEVRAALHKKKLVIVNFRYGQRIALTYRALSVVAAIILALFATTTFAVYRFSLGDPPSAEALAWYDEGVKALRQGTYLQATTALSNAIDADKDFALAHARLADAWAELDFTSRADHEMLLASGSEAHSIPKRDRRYVEAVQHTLERNYSAAAQDYEAILRTLPDSRKSEGYVDLGRAYEKAGKIKETIASYERAAQLNPNDPAPFVHLGIWQSRQRNPAAAELAFAKSETLYAAMGKYEGVAEVDYQRGYAANEEADSEHAREYLNRSLTFARQTHNVQMEARSLSQLSSVEYNSGKDDQAIVYANETMELARENGLEYWYADGLMRLGNAYLDKEDFTRAELVSRQALQHARQGHHPRIEADTAFTLASLRDQQSIHPEEQITLAQEALSYYKDYGFMNMAAASSVLVLRGEETKGNFAEALRLGSELIAMAVKTRTTIAMETAEEVVGMAALGLEDYPTSLLHFQHALESSRLLHQNEAYQQKHCADVLWRLGRYHEAEQLLAALAPTLPGRTDMGSNIAEIRARMQLSTGHYRTALATSQRALHDFPHMNPDVLTSITGVEALAEANLGQSTLARHDTDRLLAAAQASGNQLLTAQAQLFAAGVFLNLHSAQEALSLAQEANQYFASKGQKESEWVSLFYLAQALKQTGQTKASQQEAAKVAAILDGLSRTWEPEVFRQYTARPDHWRALSELVKLKVA